MLSEQTAYILLSETAEQSAVSAIVFTAVFPFIRGKAMAVLPPIDSFQGEYYFLSNFSRSKIDLEEGSRVISFRTVEHGYQWWKVTSPVFRDRIQRATTPLQAKRLGNNRYAVIRLDWENQLPKGPDRDFLVSIKVPPIVKVRVMLYLLRKKFSQSLRASLLKQTHPRILIEGNTWNDQFWGVCEGEGLNVLGKLEMAVRHELITQGKPQYDTWTTTATYWSGYQAVYEDH